CCFALFHQLGSMVLPPGNLPFSFVFPGLWSVKQNCPRLYTTSAYRADLVFVNNRECGKAFLSRPSQLRCTRRSRRPRCAKHNSPQLRTDPCLFTLARSTGTLVKLGTAF